MAENNKFGFEDQANSDENVSEAKPRITALTRGQMEEQMKVYLVPLYRQFANLTKLFR